jgi:hypothetical protein
MNRVTQTSALLIGAIVLLIAGACGDFNFDLKPGTIKVTNTSATDTAVVAILADDAKSYPTLGPGASATVKTNIGGTYRVIVVFEQQNLVEYLDSLKALRGNVEKIIDGTSSTDEKILFFTHLATIKSAISQVEQTGGAGCSGKIKLGSEEDSAVQATVNNTSVNGTGVWDISCGSN